MHRRIIAPAVAGLIMASTGPSAALAVDPPLDESGGGFFCSAWAATTDSAVEYSGGVEQYPVHDWLWLLGPSYAGVSSQPCEIQHAEVAQQSLPLTGPDGSEVVATVTVAGGAVDTQPPVGVAGAESFSRPLTVTVRAAGLVIVVEGLRAAAFARCQTSGGLPTLASDGAVGTVTVNGVKREIASRRVAVGPVGLTFNEVVTWNNPGYGGLWRTALSIDNQPNLHLHAGADLSADGYARIRVGDALVAYDGDPCAP